MKLSKGKLLTGVAVLVFVLVFLWGRDAESAEVGIGLGFGTFNAEGAVSQEISVASDDMRWFASYTRIGGDADRLVPESINRYVGAYRVFWRRDARLKPYMSLGVAYWDPAPEYLVSDRLSYDMRLGLRWRDVVELELDDHNSTAGRSRRNTGLDQIVLRATFRF